MDNEDKIFLKENKDNYLDNIKLAKIAISKINNKTIFFCNIIFVIINIIIISGLFYKKYFGENNIITYYDNNTGNYSLYNVFKYPQISILIPNIENINKNDKNITLYSIINSLRKQTLKDIEIIFLLPKIDNNNYKIIHNFTLIDKRIRIVFKNSEKTNLFNLYNLIFQSKGKFILFNDNFEVFQSNELEKSYNSTKGKINYIFKFKSNKGNYFYLIKGKTVKDTIDQDLKLEQITDIINYINLLPNPNINYVNVALCPDNHYTPYTYVAMLSILKTKYYFTYISFYLIIDEDFETKNKDFLLSLYDQYDLFNVTFLKMDDRYKNAYISRYLTTQTYYRFSIGELIPYLNRIIYLDTDIIVYNDLTEFHELNFKGKMILGHPTFFNTSPKTGVYKINNGVLLLNLDRMRKNKIEWKVLYILNNHFENDYHDQFLLNQYFYEFIGIFPPKYHVRPWNNYEEIKDFNIRSGHVFNHDYLYFSCKYPVITHYAYNSKPIFNNISKSEDWWYFARMSKYFKQKTENISLIFNYTYE